MNKTNHHNLFTFHVQGGRASSLLPALSGTYSTRIYTCYYIHTSAEAQFKTNGSVPLLRVSRKVSFDAFLVHRVPLGLEATFRPWFLGRRRARAANDPIWHVLGVCAYSRVLESLHPTRRAHVARIKFERVFKAERVVNIPPLLQRQEALDFDANKHSVHFGVSLLVSGEVLVGERQLRDEDGQHADLDPDDKEHNHHERPPPQTVELGGVKVEDDPEEDEA
mmetsp:Transcript_58576/g.141268  ORF Transcript_58576/g.141268 Transcript_58576/m.141268 type:complete len:222 (-) Transcript_58576:231-896(-)